MQVEDPYLEIVLNTRETLPNFFLKSSSVGLLGDVSPMRRSRPEWGRDSFNGCSYRGLET